MGQNVGRASLKVVFLDRSPFGSQGRQENSHYFTQDNFATLNAEDCVALPYPINGIRLKENVVAYDNFIEDKKGVRLEDAYFKQTTTVINQGTAQPTTETVKTQLDPVAMARLNDITTTATVPGATVGELAAKTVAATPIVIPDNQRNFFTWVVSENLFKLSQNNPPPPDFTKLNPSNAPAWTYISMPRPGAGNKAFVLTPFMRTAAPDTTKPVHWGCKTKTGLALNQPFEIIFYSCNRDPAIAKDASPLESAIKFVDRNGNVLDADLTKSVYIAIEIGTGNSQHNYLFLFKNEEEPYFFQLQGGANGRQAVLLARFAGFNAAKLFDRNQKYFTVSIEPVMGSLIVRSNAFQETPWILLAPTYVDEETGNRLTVPIFMGSGPIAVYGGNIQGSLAMRPIQYKPTGNFTTPETSFEVLLDPNDGSHLEPSCSTALKGDGEVEQNRSYDSNSESGPAIGEIQMVDAEEVNGAKVVTALEHDKAQKSVGPDVNRKVSLTLSEVNDASTPAPIQNIPITTKGYVTKVDMNASNAKQGAGGDGDYIVVNGKSPYIWMVRCELPSVRGQQPNEFLDISCDVMTLELSWNATSYQEFSHTGTLKMLNNKQNGIDYRQFTNRAMYIRIYAWWEVASSGKGPADPANTIAPVFEGLCTSSDRNTVAERETVTFKLEDYMNVLHGVKFNLCPFYDGMKAALAVRDIVMQTGLPNDKIYFDDVLISNAALKDEFGLPFANPFEEPQCRFKNGTSLKEGILDIAKRDFKTVYFDQFGNFHYDDMPGALYNTRAFTVKANFFTSLLKGGSPRDQVFNSVSLSRLINDVYNSISIQTVSRLTNARLVLGTSYRAGMFDPNAEGYLGYPKRLFLNDAMLGGVDALGRYVDTLRRRVFIAPLTARFETYGRAGIKPLDVITLDGQIMRIMNISMNFDSSQNQWWMNVEGEWQFAAANKDESILPPQGNPVEDVAKQVAAEASAQ